MEKSVFEWLKQFEDAIVAMQDCVHNPTPILDNADYILALTKYAEAYRNIIEIGLIGPRVIATERAEGKRKPYIFKRPPGGNA